MGDMADYNLEGIDSFSRCPVTNLRPKTITCKRCGTEGLHWMNTQHGWRTAKGNEIHVCPIWVPKGSF